MTSRICIIVHHSSESDYAFMFRRLKQLVDEKFRQTEKKGSLLTDKNIQPILKFAILRCK